MLPTPLIILRSTIEIPFVVSMAIEADFHSREFSGPMKQSTAYLCASYPFYRSYLENARDISSHSRIDARTRGLQSDKSELARPRDLYS